MKKRFLLSTALVSTLLTTQASASELLYQGTSVGVQAGIFGLGANVKGKFTDTLGAKIGFDSFTYNDIKIESEDADFLFDVHTQDFLGTLDWHPWGGSFKLSGGVIVNGTDLDGDITPNIQGEDISFTFNGVDHSYKTSELGSIKTTADFDPVAPYVGFGWDTSFASMQGFGFTFDIGVAHQGAIRTSYDLVYGDALDIDKATADIPDGAQKAAKIADIKAKRKEIEDALKSDIDKEMGTLQDELNKYEWAPFISIGFNYKF